MISKNSIRHLSTTAIAVAMASLQAGCGGFTSVNVGGTIAGLTGTGLVLGDGVNRVSVPPNSTTFTLPAQVDIRADYNVVVVKQPTRQTCVVANAAGMAGAAPVTIISVTCNTNTYKLGGTVSGLLGSNLILTNGSDTLAIAQAGNGSFTFPTEVGDGSTYGVAVLQQPIGPSQTCTVTNGSSVVNTPMAAGITDVVVSCI